MNGQRCVISAIYDLYDTACHRSSCQPVTRVTFTRMIKKCFGGVTVATRRVKEGERSVAHRFFINLSLKSQVPSLISTNSDIMALFEEQKPTGVYVTSKSKQCISFSVKTEFSVNGVATTKDLTVYKDGMIDIHCLGKRLNVTEFGLEVPIRQNLFECFDLVRVIFAIFCLFPYNVTQNPKLFQVILKMTLKFCKPLPFLALHMVLRKSFRHLTNCTSLFLNLF